MKADVEAKRLLSTLDDGRIDTEVRAVIVEEPMMELKNTLLSFFSDRLRKIQEKESFLKKVQDAIESKIDEDEMKVTDLLAIFRAASGEMNMATEAILSLFRPSKDGVVTPLLTGSQKSDRIGEAFADSSPEELALLDKLTKIVQMAREKGSSD